MTLKCLDPKLKNNIVLYDKYNIRGSKLFNNKVIKKEENKKEKAKFKLLNLMSNLNNSLKNTIKTDSIINTQEYPIEGNNDL